MPVPEREAPTFAKARSQEALGHLARSMLGRPSLELLALEEVQERLRAFDQSYIGFRAIPVDKVVGSVDRTADFDRHFRPRNRRLRERWRQVEMAFPEGDFPPISVYKAGDVYFVSDGHHRVGIARQRGMASIDAQVTEIHTPYELAPDVDVAVLVHLEQARIFLEESGLGEARPSALIEFSRPEGYPKLLEVVRVHGYLMTQGRGELLGPEQVAGDWYDDVYIPVLGIIKDEGLREAFPWKTDGDLYLYVYQRRRNLSPTRGRMDFRQAAIAVKEERDLHPYQPPRHEMREIQRRRTISRRDIRT
jgi:hypothetical protein